MKYTIPPIGSKWSDNDERMRGRTVEVVAIEGDRAVVKNCHSSAQTKVAFKNFYKEGRQRGFSLVKS